MLVGEIRSELLLILRIKMVQLLLKIAVFRTFYLMHFRKQIASSSRQTSKNCSTPLSSTKKERHPCGCLSFLEQHFCYAKVVACGRVTEREWGNPSKVPPSHSPFLAVGGSADNKTCGQSQKQDHPPGWFCFWWLLILAKQKSGPRLRGL